MTQVLKTVKVVEDESLRSVRALESALESMGQDIQGLYREDEIKMTSSPEDLIKVVRAVADATASAVSASHSRNQEDIETVANTGRKVVTELLTTVKGLEFPSEELKEEVYKLGHTLANQCYELLSNILVGVHNDSEELKDDILDIARSIAHSTAEMTKLAAKVAGEDLVDPEDPMVIAERELNNAADAIELAAKRLAELRPRQEVVTPAG